MIPRPLHPLAALALLAALPCAAQPVDSTARRNLPADTARPPKTGYVMTKDPTTAMLLSIVPGLGQYYNEQYWKVPVFGGAAGFFIYRIITLNNLYRQKADEAAAAGQNSPLYPTLKLQRESYRDDRDLNGAYLLGVTVLSMIDAYVGAHLFDFDVGDDLSSKLQLAPSGLGISVRF